MRKNKGRVLGLVLSRKNARHIEKFKEYSKLIGVPLDDVLEECFSEYRQCTVETGIECLAERAASA
jgi:hypothetical protein